MVEAFALKRNPALSFPFLKENGELLAITIDSGFLVEPRALEHYADFHSKAFKLTKLYPQYYRFILSMVIHLEAGGLQVGEAAKIADYVIENDLLLLDTSETRKLETLTLLSNLKPLSKTYKKIYDGIVYNVDQLIKNPELYTKFNKPLFYDLTHIIFFLSDYGKKSLPLQNDVTQCLIYIGLLALLDNDADLLAEVCVCLRYINSKIARYWDDFLQKSLKEIKVTYHDTVMSALNPSADEYHIYLVLNWYQALQKRPAFETRFNGEKPSFSLPEMPQSVLSKLSDYSHQVHFNGKNANQSISQFVSGLNDYELGHWNLTLSSSEHFKNLVEGFSGLRL